MRLSLAEIGRIADMFRHGLNQGLDGRPKMDFNLPDLQGPRPSQDAVDAYEAGYALGKKIQDRPQDDA